MHKGTGSRVLGWVSHDNVVFAKLRHNCFQIAITSWWGFNHILVVWGLLIYNRFVKGEDFRSSSFSRSWNDFAVIISLDPFSATLVAVFLTRFESALNYCSFLFKNSGILILRNMLRSYFSFSYVCRSNQAGLFLIICNYFNKVHKNINPNNVSEF